MSSFFIEAFEHVHRDRVEQYLALSIETDAKVRQSEPENVIHVQTRVAENEQTVTFRWVEVFSSPDGLLTHINNPVVREHIRKLNDGLLSGPPEVVIYCDWDDEQKASWLQTPGVNISFADISAGYF